MKLSEFLFDSWQYNWILVLILLTYLRHSNVTPERFFVFFAILQNNLQTERNIETQIWFLRIMIHIILCSDRRKYAYRLEPDGYRIENFGEKMQNFEIWWIMLVFRKIENIFNCRNTSINHQISKFFIFSPKFSIRYSSGSNRYESFRRFEHKLYV